jgi:hypothetical protein
MKHTLAMVTAMLVVLLGSTAFADKSQDSEASSFFSSGVELFNKENYQEAVVAFRKAYELKPSWRIQYNIGQCEAALKRYGLAIEAFESYLGAGGDEVPIERRDEVLKELERMRLMVGSIKVQGEDGTEVYVDEVLRGTMPINSAILVTAGVAHTVWFVKDGKKVATFKETISGQETVLLKAKAGTHPPLVAPAPDPTTPPDRPAGAAATGSGGAADKPADKKPDQVPEAETPKKRKPLSPALFWVGTSAAVVFGGATLALALVIDSKWEAAEKDVAENPWDYDSADADTIRMMQFMGYAAMGIGAAGLIMAVVSAPFTDWRRGKPPKDGAAVSLKPWRTASTGGLVIEGRF